MLMKADVAGLCRQNNAHHKIAFSFHRLTRVDRREYFNLGRYPAFGGSRCFAPRCDQQLATLFENTTAEEREYWAPR